MAAQASPVLIVAMSGRALAQSARAAGLAPFVLDAFGDEDMLAAAAGWALLPRRPDGRLDAPAIVELAEVHLPPPAPLVWGACLDGQATLLGRLAAGRSAGGTPATALRRLKSPQAFATLCRKAGVAHPPTQRMLPHEPAGWLVKRAGGSGGGHVRAAESRQVTPGSYAQQWVAGQPVAALLLACAGAVRVLGFSAQWTDSQDPDSPWRFAGVAAPLALPAALRGAMADAATRVAAAAGVVGLASADFLVSDDGTYHLLEINPRPGAALEIFERIAGCSLLPWHLSACRGQRLLPPALPERRAAAAQIVYAAREVTLPPGIDWPAWVADRPRPGTLVQALEPLCTVLAEDETAAAARALVGRRAAAIRRDLISDAVPLAAAQL